MKSTDEQLKFLGAVYINFKRSELAYRNYLDNGRRFLFAKILWSCNKSLHGLLLENAYLLPEYLLNDAVQLIVHFDIWMEKWQALKQQVDPASEDEFVFENTFTFPKSSAQNLENEFLKLRSHKE